MTVRTDYFELATQLARAEGYQTLAGIAKKAVALRAIAERDDYACHCSASNVPHLTGSGDCPGLRMSDPQVVL